MLTKEEYLAKAKAHLDEWQADLEVLRAKAADASGDVKAAIEEHMAELKARWEAGAAKRQEMMEAADDRWEDLKGEAEERWAELTTGVKSAFERIRSHFV